MQGDPTDDFITMGEKKGTSWEWTCNFCGSVFIFSCEMVWAAAKDADPQAVLVENLGFELLP